MSADRMPRFRRDEKSRHRTPCNLPCLPRSDLLGCAQEDAQHRDQRHSPPFDVPITGCYDRTAGWSSLVARWAHNPKVGGSNPPPQPTFRKVARFSFHNYSFQQTKRSFRVGRDQPDVNLRFPRVAKRLSNCYYSYRLISIVSAKSGIRQVLKIQTGGSLYRRSLTWEWIRNRRKSPDEVS